MNKSRSWETRSTRESDRYKFLSYAFSNEQRIGGEKGVDPRIKSGDRNIKNFIAAIALAAAVIWWL